MSKIALFLRIDLHRELKQYSFFDMGVHSNYFDDFRNKNYVLEYVNSKLIPTIDFLNSIKDEGFKFNLSISGNSLDLFEEYNPEAISLLKVFVSKDFVELLFEPNNGSIEEVMDKEKIVVESKEHFDRLTSTFGFKPKIFRSSDLRFSLLADANLKNLKGMLVKSNVNSDNVYVSKNNHKLLVQSSDKLVVVNDNVNVICVNFESFEQKSHQEDITVLLKNHKFVFGSDLLSLKAVNEDVSHETSVFNKIQTAAILEFKELENKLKALNQESLLDELKLFSSHMHFYKMCDTKLGLEESPYEAFINYNNALRDIARRASLD
jgi:hypothetical protein